MTRILTLELISKLNQENATAFREHENGILELTIVKTNPNSLDNLITLLSYLAEGETPTSPTIRLLVDASRVAPVVAKAASRARKFVQDYPDRPPLRLVWFVGGGTLPAQMAQTLLQSLRIKRYKGRLMQASERDEAIRWLLADD